MHLPSQPLTGDWPQLSNWQVKPVEALADGHALATFTSIRNRLREGHAMSVESLNARSPVRASGVECVECVECGAVQVDDYMHDVLAALVTPQDGSPSRRYTRNADLRASVATALALHPDGGDALLEARLKALGLPSLLRDESQYLPGTLEALRYDVGSRIVAIERSRLPDLADLEAPGDAALHAAGARELAYLDAGHPHAAQVALDHKRILDFHYRAAGATTWERLPGSRSPVDRESRGTHESNESEESGEDRQSRERNGILRSRGGGESLRQRANHEQGIGRFLEHLVRCRQRREPAHPPAQASERVPISQDIEVQRSRRKAKGESPPYPPHPLSPRHDILYNCTLL
ncbi:hypothetical protein AB870_04830 [Pandoraea faecigallinarum]|nr:hypothetical protein [Pandoraea faecigallinarum]AKM29596.3 hypothetical protein AB870_04830 [Pandoraea faecigallinarum]